MTYRNGKAHESYIAKDGKYIVVNSKFVSTSGDVEKFSNIQIEPLYKGEIAFVLSDVPNGRALARTYLIENNDKYTLNQRIAGLTPNYEMDNYFLHILLNRNSYFLSFDDGAKQTNLSISDVLNFEFKAPSKNEQNKIGNLFKDLDSLITLHQRECQVLINTKKALLEKMFPSEHEAMPKIRFKGFSDAWEQRKLGEITYQSGEKNIDDLPYESYSVSNTEGFINQKEQFKYGGLVSIADKSKSIIVTPHTFAYNPARIDIGSIGYQNLDRNVIISPMYEIFKTKNEFLEDRFLWHWLKSDIFNRIVVNNQEGGVRTCFNLPKFFEAYITIPKSIKEQTLIGKFFDTLDQLITLHQRKGFLLKKGQKVYCATKSLLCYKKFLVQIRAIDHL